MELEKILMALKEARSLVPTNIAHVAVGEFEVQIPPRCSRKHIASV